MGFYMLCFAKEVYFYKQTPERHFPSCCETKGFAIGEADLYILVLFPR